MTAATPTADPFHDEPTLASRARKAETYRATRRNRDRANGGLSTKHGPSTSEPRPQPAIAHKQTREAARRLRQRARKAA